MGDLKQNVALLLQEAEHLRIGSGYAAAWGNFGAGESSVYCGKVSHLNGAEKVNAHTYFDLASLTKVLATTSVLMALHEAQQIDVHAPLQEHPHLSNVTLAQLLSHTSGLPAWKPYYEDLRSRFGNNLPFVSIQQRKDFFYEQILKTQLEARPGEKVIYSDVGFSVIGYFLEEKFSKTIGELAQELVWSKIKSIHPLTLHYRPVHCDSAGALNPYVAATEVCLWRGWLQGQVHDDNSWSMGGVSAHTGVFGTLNDVTAWMKALIGGQIVSQKTLRQYFSEVTLNSGSGARRTLGFDQPSLDGSGTTGFAYGPSTVGHLGFTGTSLWMDLDTGNYACLLTNRVHPSRGDVRIRDLRIQFHALNSQHGHFT